MELNSLMSSDGFETLRTRFEAPNSRKSWIKPFVFKVSEVSIVLEISKALESLDCLDYLENLEIRSETSRTNLRVLLLLYIRRQIGITSKFNSSLLIKVTLDECLIVSKVS